VLAFLHLEAFREITASREETTDERAVHPVIDWTPLKTGDLKAIEIADTHGWFSRPKYVIVTPDEEIDTSPTAEEAKKHKSMLDIKSAKEFKSEMKDLKQGMKGSKDVRKEVLIFDRADAELVSSSHARQSGACLTHGLLPLLMSSSFSLRDCLCGQDERGWATKMTIEDDHMKKQEPTMYELWQTSEAEIGSFGGPGMRKFSCAIGLLCASVIRGSVLTDCGCEYNRALLLHCPEPGEALLGNGDHFDPDDCNLPVW